MMRESVLAAYVTYDFNAVIDTAGISGCYDGGASFRVSRSFTFHGGTANGDSVNVSYVTICSAIVIRNTTVARRENVYGPFAVATLKAHNITHPQGYLYVRL